MTGKQYGYVVQALAEEAKRSKDSGDMWMYQKLWVTLQGVLKVKQLGEFFGSFDEEQLYLIGQALEDTAERRQIWATTVDATRMSETAEMVREAKKQRENEWVRARFQEGIA